MQRAELFFLLFLFAHNSSLCSPQNSTTSWSVGALLYSLLERFSVRKISIQSTQTTICTSHKMVVCTLNTPSMPYSPIPDAYETQLRINCTSEDQEHGEKSPETTHDSDKFLNVLFCFHTQNIFYEVIPQEQRHLGSTSSKSIVLSKLDIS